MTSIHPRVESGGTKSNTCKPKKSRSKHLDRKLKNLNRRQSAHAITVRSIKGNEAAYRMPGSMNEHK